MQKSTSHIFSGVKKRNFEILPKCNEQIKLGSQVLGNEVDSCIECIDNRIDEFDQDMSHSEIMFDFLAIPFNKQSGLSPKVV